MIDWNKSIALAVRTGKVTFGFKETIDAIRGGKAKIAVFASNLPEEKKRRLQFTAKSSSIPLHQYGGSSIDLGVICSKPFTVSTLAVREPGDSDILKQGGQ
jgi:large subunit ribosomal protein L30e